MPKVLVLLSGGLDSILAVKILQEQNIEVVGVIFQSYFFGPEAAAKAAGILNIPLRVADFSVEHLAMVKNPRYGYGRAANPCIDCHGLMLKQAGEMMRAEEFDAVATGEVLGERPMSQNKNSLAVVEKISGLKGHLLRPLSAKLLAPTVPEQDGRIDRAKLLDISGRGRHRQMELAARWGIKEYPTPAGGCLLTDPGFGRRLKELLSKYPNCDGNDMELLKVGRHFWDGGLKIVIGRTKEENEQIQKLSQADDILLKLQDFSGPLTLIRGRDIGTETIEKAASWTAHYSTKARNFPTVAASHFQNEEWREISVSPSPPPN